MKVYLANGLFSAADQLFNRYIANEIRSKCSMIDLYVPQENEALNDKMNFADSLMIFNGDNRFLDDSLTLIAVIDGVEIDSGVAAEIGRFSMLCEKDILQNGKTNRRILALYTDVRQQGTENEKKINALKQDPTENQFLYRNLYVVGAIKKYGKIFSSIESLVDYLQKNQ
ncbi:nucleoside 2-deoxyribosyltransferase [Massilibacterium senegalense]|uniref:nucleoside 2-deoxyribosyltransferase n=1 Tax=Massilibacterium senegalense TaxID=1632858 RepID=UPI000785DCF8|nr:nucleoside 2-deoxyribosyltransferase [Massilibacterium senegalense]